MSIDEAHAALVNAAASADRVSRARRAVPVGMVAVPVAMLAVVGVLAVIPAIRSFTAPENLQMLKWLNRVGTTEATGRFADPAIRDAAERYISYRWAPTLASDEFWAPIAAGGNMEQLRETADAILARHPSVSAEEFEQANIILAPEIAEFGAESGPTTPGASAGNVALLFLTALGVVVALVPSVVSSLAVPGGLATRLLGFAVVTRRGVEIGRLRSLARVLVAWLPCLAWLIYLARAPRIQGFVPNPPEPMAGAAVVLGLMLAGALWTIARPSRGPHDWLTGTWIVPR